MKNNNQIRFQMLGIVILSIALIRLISLIANDHEAPIAPYVPTVPATMETSLVETITIVKPEPKKEVLKPRAKAPKQVEKKPEKLDTAPTVTFINPQQFLAKAVPIARKVSRETGVPASIILAQSMVESASGSSTLAKKANNFFGHKCFSTRCKRGHCINREDDTHKDFFLVYQSMQHSFKSHAEKISSGRYRSLTQYGRNYKKWAKGLKAKGYATDPGYATKLIGTIERYKLQKYD